MSWKGDKRKRAIIYLIKTVYSNILYASQYKIHDKSIVYVGLDDLHELLVRGLRSLHTNPTTVNLKMRQNLVRTAQPS